MPKKLRLSHYVPGHGRRRRAIAMRYRGRVRAAGIRRVVYNAQPSFVETLQAAPLTTNQGGIFTVSFNSIPEHAQYTALYKQFRINSLEVIVVPRFNAFEGNQFQSNVTGPPIAPGISMPRICFAVNNSAGETLPTSELQVLEDNGCRIKMLTGSKVLKMKTTAPVANVGVSDYGAAIPHTVAENKPGRWLDIDSAVDIQHYGISYWVTGGFGPSGGGLAYIADVFYKVSFTLKDPR